MECIGEPNIEVRIKFLARKKVCYGCLQPMEDGYSAKAWKKRLSCITCEEKNPAPLFGYIPKNKKVIDDGSQSQNE